MQSLAHTNKNKKTDSPPLKIVIWVLLIIIFIPPHCAGAGSVLGAVEDKDRSFPFFFLSLD